VNVNENDENVNENVNKKPHRGGGGRIHLHEVKELLIAVKPSLAPVLAGAGTMTKIRAAVSKMMTTFPSVPGLPAGPLTTLENIDATRFYKVYLTKIGDNLIGAIKAIRNVTCLGLKEAKDLMDEVRGLNSGGPRAMFVCTCQGHMVENIDRNFRAIGSTLVYIES
jgi:ribosomal protein L7/L12